MPSFLQVIKDTSPLLVYSQEWRPGTSETDNLLDQYSLSTFTLTQAQGATMNFNFFGSYIGVFGARRNNHGNYMVQMDGTLSPTFNGEAANAEFNQTLYSANVDLGFHNMTIINGGNTFFDIDYLAFETSMGQDDETLIVNTFKDTHPSFTYVPSSAWTIPNRVGTFLGGTGHATTQPSAKVVLTFQVSSFFVDRISLTSKREGQVPSSEVHYFDFKLVLKPCSGDAVALYGPVGPNNTQAYSVQVDSGNPSFLNANKASYRPQEVLFYAGNLGSGQHTLQVQLPSTANGEFAIDYATVYTTPSLGGSFLAATPATKSSLPTGTAAALAITTTLAALASLLCMYLFWRHRFQILRYSPPNPVSTRSIFSIRNSSLRPAPFVTSPGEIESNSVQDASAIEPSFGHSRTPSNAASQSLSAVSGPTSVGNNSAGESLAPSAPATFRYGYPRNEKTRVFSSQRIIAERNGAASSPNDGPYSAGQPPPSYF